MGLGWASFSAANESDGCVADPLELATRGRLVGGGADVVAPWSVELAAESDAFDRWSPSFGPG
jgi:hypothetical protein